ncbi:cysteine proteinases superfamily protein [Striga asiatica]|uniref:Cysteine proteinases superfamily protein n=1 Tax=Striga asiatica TaxID=4170 RepID=A0A5A7RHR3_STRAF|nr:cysteine proteinases superfamily protein [Striga asiatica]
MKISFIVLLLLLCTLLLSGLGFEYSADELEDMGSLYERWRAYYNKLDEPTNDRFPAFRENVLRIHHFNQLDEQYKLGLNQFSDLTAHEFAARHGCQPGPHQPLDLLEEEFSQLEYHTSDVPTSVDWRAKGAVTYVKNQLNCKSCWAFSAVGAVEGINFVRTGRLVSLSAQELVDCDKRNNGCRKGNVVRAFDFIRDRGITSERVYPYVGKQRICDSTKVKSPVVKIAGYKRIPPNNEKALMQAVAQQPVSAAIAADNDFVYYKTGIYNGNCSTASSSKDLNHAVTVVGYGMTKQGIKFWTVKNSWGGSWGENGYIRMARDVKYKSGMCGIAIEASYPISFNVLLLFLCTLLLNGLGFGYSADELEDLGNLYEYARSSAEALMRAVAHQPVSAFVSIDGEFKSYKKGVFTGWCDVNLTHIVTVVGYGATEQGTKFWIVKNSWGSWWGDNGYIRLARDVTDERGQCGIAMRASYPMINEFNADGFF